MRREDKPIIVFDNDIGFCRRLEKEFGREKAVYVLVGVKRVFDKSMEAGRNPRYYLDTFSEEIGIDES